MVACGFYLLIVVFYFEHLKCLPVKVWSFFIFEKTSFYYYSIINVVPENNLKTAILSFITITTIYCPANFVIVTGPVNIYVQNCVISVKMDVKIVK